MYIKWQFNGSIEDLNKEDKNWMFFNMNPNDLLRFL